MIEGWKSIAKLIIYIIHLTGGKQTMKGVKLKTRCFSAAPRRPDSSQVHAGLNFVI